MALRVTELTGKFTLLESFQGIKVSVTQVVKGIWFFVTLHVDPVPFNFIDYELRGTLVYANNGHNLEISPCAACHAVKIECLRTEVDKCFLRCRLLTLSSQHEHRHFAIQFRLTNNDGFFAEAFTPPLHSWARLRDADEHLRKFHSLKRARPADTQPPPSLESAFAMFLHACRSLPTDERPAKLRRLVAELNADEQSLVSDVSFFLSHRELPPVPWDPPTSILPLNVDTDTFLM